MSRENSEIERLNERLRIGMAEAHHRVKNTLQNIISYINIMFSQRESVGKEDIQKLTSYIHSLKTLHDILLEEVVNKTESGHVRIDRILSDVIEIHSVNKEIIVEELPAMLGTPRRAATLSLILTELLNNAERFGDGAILIQIEPIKVGEVAMNVRNRVKDVGAAKSFVKSNGLRLVDALSKADLGTIPHIEADDLEFAVTINFPVEAIDE